MCFIHFRVYNLRNYWPDCFVFGSLKFPMAVVHTDLYISSLSILDMGQADKSCFPLVSQTEFFLICPLRPCHVFGEFLDMTNHVRIRFLRKAKMSYSLIKAVKITSDIYCCYYVQNKAKPIMMH